MLIARNPFPHLSQTPERNPDAMDLGQIHELGTLPGIYFKIGDVHHLQDGETGYVPSGYLT